MDELLRVLVVGEGWHASLGMSYVRAFKRLGCDVRLLDQHRRVSNSLGNLTRRAIRRITVLPDALPLNWDLRRVIVDRSWVPDLIFVNKGIYLFKSTLHAIKKRTGAALVHLFNDDYFHPSFSSRLAICAIPAYDYIFTPCRFNIPELYDAGAKRVEFLPFGYDPDINVPVELAAAEQAEYGADVAFIGSFRPERAKLLEEVVRLKPKYTLRVWGNNWNKLRLDSPLRPHLVGREATGLEMCKVVCASKVCLAFVTHFGPGRSIHVMRTFEIPACRGMMLAERANGEYADFYDEGVEMACFDGAEELHENAQRYLGDEELRCSMAESSYKRTMIGPYSYVDRAREVIRATFGDRIPMA